MSKVYPSNLTQAQLRKYSDCLLLSQDKISSSRSYFLVKTQNAVVNLPENWCSSL